MIARRVLSRAMDATVVPGFSRIGYAVRSRLGGWAEVSSFDLSGKTVVVTGPTSGIGEQVARLLAPTGAHLVLVARDAAKCARTAEMLRPFCATEPEVVICDMGDLDAVRDASRAIASRHGQVHALVHNAGALFTERETSPQGIESTIASHVLGPHLMTSLLLPALRAARGRVVTVSSGGMYAVPVPDCRHGATPEMSPEKWNGTRQYAIAKRMQVVLSDEWSRREPDVFFAAMHPGWADTPGVQSSIPLFGRITAPILRTAREGADTVAWLAAVSADDLGRSGRFWCDREAVSAHRLPSTKRSDTHDARTALWEWCELQVSGWR
jgi:NAD(P)-dependent dehydrogenase (short-subunit alcohol dehydrogenase family)